MKQAPTLVDSIYRATFRNETLPGWKSNAALRERLRSAHKFRLTEPMSSFLGELSSRAFAPTEEEEHRDLWKEEDKTAWKERMNRQIEALRVSAFAPHQVTWIEYNLRAALIRSNELLKLPYNPGQSPEIEGWLIERHPELTTAFRLTLFTWLPGAPDADGFEMYTFPVTYAWTIDDGPPPWRRIPGERHDSRIVSGLWHYDSPSVAITNSELMKPIADYPQKLITGLVEEWVGILRRCWALLATINDLPLIYSDARAAKGFVAKGQYRRFLDHTTITITVPRKEQTKIAKQAIALARRRGHQVREHWRNDWRNPPSKRCLALLESGLHAWTAEQRCAICGGRRFRVHEHQRGDASLGFVTHEYNIRHAEN